MRIVKVFTLVLFAWLVISLLLGKFDTAFDGSAEIGFPLAFYQEYTGKCSNCPQETRFVVQGLLIDLVCVFGLTILISKVFFKKSSL